jgi:S1 RNA binding domain protein
MLVEVVNIIEGRVSGITNFGAFVQLPDGKTGLVHISEVAEEYVKDIKAHLSENQPIKVRVISVDNKGKISLSIKRAAENYKENTKVNKPAEFDWSRSSMETLSFEDRLARFMKESEEKMHDLKKNIDSKRGGGYKKY